MTVWLSNRQLELIKTVEQFLYHEARLMDGRHYDAWYSLWTDDGIYFVPVNDEHSNPKHHVALIYETRDRLGDRIAQLNSNVHWAQEPRSHLQRVVSNVEVEEAADGVLIAHSNFILLEVRRDQQMVLAGRSEHHLRPDGTGFKIAYKKVVLANLDAVMRNIRFLL